MNDLHLYEWSDSGNVVAGENAGQPAVVSGLNLAVNSQLEVEIVFPRASLDAGVSRPALADVRQRADATDAARGRGTDRRLGRRAGEEQWSAQRRRCGWDPRLCATYGRRSTRCSSGIAALGQQGCSGLLIVLLMLALPIGLLLSGRRRGGGPWMGGPWGGGRFGGMGGRFGGFGGSGFGGSGFRRRCGCGWRKWGWRKWGWRRWGWRFGFPLMVRLVCSGRDSIACTVSAPAAARGGESTHG